MGQKVKIQIDQLSKSFGTVKILENINLEFEEGKIYGLVGRNGSGKTVLLKLICGLLSPTEGTISFSGLSQQPKEFSAENMGILIENPGFLPEYDAFHNLKYLADIRKKIGKEEIKQAIRLVGLDPDSKKHVGKYSLGMRERLGIAQAIMEDPQILLLDEPMNGLDNEGVEDIRRLLIRLKESNKLIILASHSKEDIGLLCDEVYRMDHGKVVEKQTVGNM